MSRKFRVVIAGAGFISLLVGLWGGISLVPEIVNDAQGRCDWVPCVWPAGAPAANQGSIRLAAGQPPSGDAGQITFSGAVNGTSHVSNEACDSVGNTFQHFTVTAAGEVAGRRYFLWISVYPYRGPGTYDLRPLPSQPLDYVSTPNPLLDEGPGGYPGFLNFLPKSEPGNAYAGSAGSTMAVEAGERSGWFDSQMVSVNQKTGAPLHLRVAGRYVCGPAFQP